MTYVAYAFSGHFNVDRNYSVNGLNQYQTAGPASFGYDGNGNLTSDGQSNFVYVPEFVIEREEFFGMIEADLIEIARTKQKIVGAARPCDADDRTAGALQQYHVANFDPLVRGATV